MNGSRVINGTGQIVLDDLHYTGSETRLIDCPNQGPFQHNCDHSKDAGVRCLVHTGKAYNILKKKVLSTHFQPHRIQLSSKYLFLYCIPSHNVIHEHAEGAIFAITWYETYQVICGII